MTVTDNSFRSLPSLDALLQSPSLRVTQIAKLLECPRQFKALLLGEGEVSDSRAARIGTAVHLVIEQFLRGERSVEDWARQLATLRIAGVSGEEQLALLRYLGELERYAPHVRALEHEFCLHLTPDAPAVKGHIDAVFRPNGGPLILRDHKTNRHFQDADWWARQWQPRLYAWSARQLWPEAHAVVFQIGYVNLGQVVQWEPDPLDWFEIEARYREAWTAFLAMSEAAVWQERLNENCVWCPVRRDCAACRAETAALYGAIGQRLMNTEEK